MINWDALNKKGYEKIRAILSRVQTITDIDDRLSLEMDLSAAHIADPSIDLTTLLESSDFDLMHDVCGIQNHINRDTGELMHCFLPRCAR